MFKSYEDVRQYCVGGLSGIPGLDKSSDYMLGYRRALENVQRYIELRQERLVQNAMDELKESA